MVELNTGEHQPRGRGQALVEYALILALLAVAFGIALAITGPAIGNVFCNVVHNLGGTTADPQGGSCGSTAPDLVNLGGDPPLFWATVTWIAGHPQNETPFPTPIRRAPTSVGAGVQPTNTPSNTPTITPTFTPTATFTPSDTSSPGPSPTNGDFAFGVPYVDQISKPEWWRLDTGDFMGYSNWTVQWYDDFTGASCTPYCNISLGSPKNFDPAYSTAINGINFDLGTGFPAGSGITNGDTWGADFNRTITVAQTATYEFTLGANNYGTVYLDGTPFLSQQANDTSTVSTTIPITAGTHALRLVYAENTINASVSLNVQRLTVNPDDTVPTPVPLAAPSSCTWGRTNSGSDPVSVPWEFDENPASDSWPGGQTCYLELRGYVDLSGHSNPSMSFWDIWDFVSASNVTAELQISPYVPTGSPPGVDRTQLSWTTIASHGLDANYAWTRHQIDLTPYAGGANKKVTFRFVIGSSSGGTPLRWYIDDIQILDGPTPTTTFTVGKTWNLDDRAQMNDFIYDGDSNKTLEDNPSITPVPPAAGPWRWNLTSTNIHGSAGMSWDDSPAGNYQGFSQEPVGSQRVHYLELKYPVDLNPATAPPADNDTPPDTGVPLLTFWQAYDIGLKSSIRVQYTRDANDAIPDNWVDIPNQGVLVDYNLPALAGRTVTTMVPVQIDLTNIPNWASQPFRLRFALYIDGAATDLRDGWYIDDIKLERQSSSPYFGYPFRDNAEYTSIINSPWDAIGGRWGTTQARGGAPNSFTTAYTDSPTGLYDAGDTQTLQLHYAIDLNHDSPLNTTHPSDSPANNPVLTFWYQRSVAAGAQLSVDLWTPHSGTWSTVWLYDSSLDSNFKTQLAWEPVEINLVDALTTATGRTWAQITANDGILDDDDIKVRFRFTSGAGSADGVYVDEIHIEDASALVHHLWPSGDGAYLDSIETGVHLPPAASSSWTQRWKNGGQWNTTSAANYYHSGSLALADSPSGNYADNTFSVLEMIPIVDLGSTVAADRPNLSFWTRYAIGSDDTFQVEIATENSADLSQSYNKLAGWTAWSAQPMMLDDSVSDSGSSTVSGTQVVTWQQGKVDLSSFIGKRIRVRFVLRVPNSTNQADGIFIDDVSFGFGATQLALPFIDNAQTMGNWTAEGSWFLGQNYFTGRGSNTLDFGATSWVGTYFDCDSYKLAHPAEDCNTLLTYSHMLADPTLADFTGGDPVDTTGPARIGPEVTTEVNHTWGSTTWPFSPASPNSYQTTFAARWNRTVDLTPGTYSFATVSEGGVRLRISDVSGTNIPVDPVKGDGSGYIINNWSDRVAPLLDFNTMTVTSAIQRTLTLEYFANQGNFVMILNATKSSYSFTDSPDPAFPTITPAPFPGNSSLVLNGFFNLASSTAPSLTYSRLYDLRANNFFYVEVSTDGGFTWTQINSPPSNDQRIIGPATLLPPTGYWEQKVADLSAFKQPNVMIRFRLDTRTAASTGDGVYIGDISVNP